MFGTYSPEICTNKNKVKLNNFLNLNDDDDDDDVVVGVLKVLAMMEWLNFV